MNLVLSWNHHISISSTTWSHKIYLYYTYDDFAIRKWNFCDTNGNAVFFYFVKWIDSESVIRFFFSRKMLQNRKCWNLWMLPKNIFFKYFKSRCTVSAITFKFGSSYLLNHKAFEFEFPWNLSQKLRKWDEMKSNKINIGIKPQTI